MARKRNVDAENHLLTGGLVTGFLTFMGFIPGAAVGAAITGSAIAKDISKAKKEEAFKRDFEAHQRKMVEVDKRWREIEKLIHELEYFSPTDIRYLEQAEIENLFKNARIVEKYDNTKKRLILVHSRKDLIKKAKKSNDKDKIVVFNYGKVQDYIIENENTYYTPLFHLDFPDHFKERCEKVGIPFKAYKYCELQELKHKLFTKHYEGTNFNFSKYY